MTFVEAAVAILKQVGQPLSVHKLTEMAVRQKLLSHVGREPEEMMAGRLLAESRKSSGHTEILKISDDVYGLKVYPPRPVVAEGAPAEEAPAAKGGAEERRPRRGRGRKSKEGALPSEPAEGAPGAAREGGETVLAPEEPGELPRPAPLPEIALPEAAPAVETAAPAGTAGEQPLPPLPEAGEELAALAEESTVLAHGLDEVVRDVEVERGPAGELPGEEGEEGRRRRKRRRGRDRERGRGGERPAAASAAPAVAPPEGRPSGAPGTMADAGYEVLRGRGDPSPLHFRQITEMAMSRGALRADGQEPWRAMRIALMVDGRERQARGLRPRVRHQGGGLFALATARLEPELLAAESSLLERVEALRVETRSALRRRVLRLQPAAFEHLSRLLVEQLGYRGVASAGRRLAGAQLLSASAERGAVRKLALIALRGGGGEVARDQLRELRDEAARSALHEVVLLTTARLAEDVVANPLPGVEVYDAAAIAELCCRTGVGVLRAGLSVQYLDPELFAELGGGHG